jgi:hypothetical protein
MFFPVGFRWVNACRERAHDRLTLCHGNGGPRSDEPEQYDWKHLPPAVLARWRKKNALKRR